MNFRNKYNPQILPKIVLLAIFIPIVIVILFFAWAIIIPVACVLFILMFFTRRKFDRNAFFKRVNKSSFYKSKQTESKNQKKSDYYDAKYIVIDNKEKK